MPQCKHYKICGLDVNPGEDLCVLHSQDPEKDKDAFEQALAAHRGKNGDNFEHFVFQEYADFRGVTFAHGANFSEAQFTEGADFFDATFQGRADFLGARFGQGAHFLHAKFNRGARFATAMFAKIADFGLTTFARDADFGSTEFSEGADFHGATFAEGGNFIDTKFARPVNFFSAEFLGIMFFASNDKNLLIFSGVEIDFRSVRVEPLDAIVIRDADLRKCKFQGTDLRKAEFTNVKWPKKGGRFRVYDEDVELQEGKAREWAHIEQLYRQLKQNYEDRRDYERAGDFHYGEKEMRRRNPDTPWWLRCLLRAYRCIGGYGERCLPPLAWSVGLLLICALLYYCLGLRPNPKIVSSSPVFISGWDYVDYSLRVMTLLKPDDLVPAGCARYARYVSTLESLAGPILLGLFALALRQRLKR
jgi:uncharacterized protein YjbI with pentapeptide repeats